MEKYRIAKDVGAYSLETFGRSSAGTLYKVPRRARESMAKKFIILLIGLVLAGCGTSGKHPSIFENPICEPPCWENITPGITTKDEAQATLSKIDIVKQPIFDLQDTTKELSNYLKTL